MTDWAWGTVEPSIQPNAFTGLWNQRGKLLQGVVNEKQRKIVIDVRDFGNVGGGSHDDTSNLTRAMNEARSESQSSLQIEPVASIAGATSGTVPQVHFPDGIYNITTALPAPLYGEVVSSGNARLIQRTAGTDHLYADGPVRLKVKGMAFVGGRHAVYYRNNNVDTAGFQAEGCEFHAQSDYAIRLGDVLAGGDCASTLAVIDKCGFYRPNKVLYTRCDRATVKRSWVHVSASNFSANQAAFMNASGDLVFDEMFGVPEMAYGGPRLASVRWVDNYGSFYSKNSRFGGEDAGMGIVWHFATPGAGVDPFTNGPAVVIEGGYVAAGPAGGADSGIIHLRTEVPQMISLRNIQGISAIPIISNSGGLNLDTYFDTYTNPQAKFRFEIQNNLSYGATAIPAQLLGYLNSWDFAQSAALPTSGYYQAGKYIKKTTPVVAGGAGSQYVVRGWTRLTDGKTHVLNTDWVEDRALTGT